jgi:alpha-ketoglutarate-dependent taurine dioxygenase
MIQAFVVFVYFIAQCAGIEVGSVIKNQDFGAQITGVNVENLSDNDFDVIHNALLYHKVIIIRNQTELTVEGQRQLTKRFGHLHVHLESSSHLPGYQDVNVVSNIKDSNGAYIGLYGAHVENFHSDLSW